MGMLTARIRKQDQVNRDTVLVQPNKKGGAVRTAAKMCIRDRLNTVVTDMIEGVAEADKPNGDEK